MIHTPVTQNAAATIIVVKTNSDSTTNGSESTGILGAGENSRPLVSIRGTAAAASVS